MPTHHVRWYKLCKEAALDHAPSQSARAKCKPLYRNRPLRIGFQATSTWNKSACYSACWYWQCQSLRDRASVSLVSQITHLLRDVPGPVHRRSPNQSSNRECPATARPVVGCKLHLANRGQVIGPIASSSRQNSRNLLPLMYRSRVARNSTFS